MLTFALLAILVVMAFNEWRFSLLLRLVEAALGRATAVAAVIDTLLAVKLPFGA